MLACEHLLYKLKVSDKWKFRRSLDISRKETHMRFKHFP